MKLGEDSDLAALLIGGEAIDRYLRTLLREPMREGPLVGDSSFL